MPIPKKTIRRLKEIEMYIKMAEKYLNRADVVGIAVKTNSPNGASYQIKNVACNDVCAVDVVNKKVGSELVGLYQGSKMLSELIEKAEQR